MSAPRRSRPVSRSNCRSHAHVGFLVILALVSLVVALGLYALRQVKATEPALAEYERRLEQAAEQPGREHQQLRVDAEE